jgi:hypothetical protein
MPRKPLTDEEFEDNFWSRVDMTSDASGCWLWTGSKDIDGYGIVCWKRKNRKTHVVSWLLTGHTIPEGLQLAHSGNCKGNPHCCNPEHLTPKTGRENILDKHRDGTMTKAKLNEQQVREIRRMLAEGELQRKIAKEFDVCQNTIWAISTGRTWSHVV